MSIKNPKQKFYECENIRSVNLTGHKGFEHWSGNVIFNLRDFTAGGKNLNHPVWVGKIGSMKFYVEYPYWVQITDEDDFILQKEFNNLPEAQKFFDDCLNDNKLIYTME